MRILVAAVLLVCACSEGGPLMAPGQDCLRCHDGGDARTWTVAGTWTRGAHVSVTDARGKNVPMRGNKVGNFYTAESLTPPFTVSVDGVEMVTDKLKSGGRVSYGGCNLCHVNSQVIAPENMAPGRDCLRCHDGNVAPRFYAGGTFSPAGRTVTIRDARGVTVTRTTNAVGNFWIDDVPLALPLQEATVDGKPMPLEKGLAPNCNACHGEGKLEDD